MPIDQDKARARVTRLMAFVDLAKSVVLEDSDTGPDRATDGADQIEALLHVMDTELQALYEEVDHA